jgi:ABC-type transport system involved in multi-copper enzyme maturation permease subunit
MKRIAIKIAKLLASPILTKELRATFRKWLFFWIFTSTLGLATIVILITAFAAYASGAHGGLSADRIGMGIFAGLTGTLSVLMIILIPGFCAAFISGERAAQSYDMLITSSLKPWEIVWGKTLTAGAYIATFLLATLPLAAMGFLYGGVTPGQILLAYLHLLATGMLIAVISICVSGMFSSVVASVIVNYIVVIGILIAQSLPALWTAGYSLIRYGPFGMSGGGLDEPLLVIINWLIYAILLIAFYIGAVNKVKPFAANRSTAVRVYSMCVTAVFLMLIMGIGLFSPGPTTADMVYTLTLVAVGGTAGLFIPFYIMLFPIEQNRQSVRILHAMYNKPRPLRLFYPGGRTGVQFTIAAVAVWYGLILALGVFPSMDSLSHDAHMATVLAAMAYAAAFLVSYALIGFLLSTTSLPQWSSRTILFAILLSNMILPWFVALMTSIGETGRSVQDSGVVYISPVGAMGALNRSPDSKEFGWIAVSIIFHVAIVVVLGAIAIARAAVIRDRHMKAMAAMPLNDQPPVPLLVPVAGGEPRIPPNAPPAGI